MSSYDPYERDRDHSRRYVREERRDDRDTRFYDRDRYDSRQYTSSRDLVPRVAREDSELSVEEIQRGFPPPTGRDIRRARSTENYYDEEYDSRYDDRRSSRRGPASVYHEEEEVRQKSKGMSKNEKIIAAVAGAALLVGGKELYDRHEAKDGNRDVSRNALSSAALAGVGALAAYQGAEFYSNQQAKKDQKATYILHRGRDGHVEEYYSDEEGDPKEKKSNKNFLESAIAATGLGAAVKSLTGSDKDKDRDDRSDTRSRGGDRDGPDDDKAKSGGGNKMQKAAMASLLAGATEAFRVAKEPGGWKGEKTKRILTAAAGAAAVDSAQSGEHGKLGTAQSVIGGLVGNRLVNGSKNEIEEDKKTGRSRSRSRARSQGGGGMSGTTGLAALATAGLGAVGAKKAYDGYRESRSRSRGRAPSDGSRGSRSPSPQKRSRSRSVVDRARNSLAKLGIGAGAGGAGALAVEDARRRDQDDYDDRGSRRGSRRYSDDYDDDYRSSRYERERDRDYYDDDRSYRGSSRRDRSRRGGNTSESDLGDSDDDVKQQKRLRGKQILTTGLATVATIHAAHGVYQSMEKRNARHKAVKEGRLSPAEAKKLKTKAMMQDAASVGIAAMGIKGAIGEMKQAKDLNHECKNFQCERARRHEKREERRRKLKEANQNNGSVKRAESWDTGRDRYDGYDSDSEDEYYGRRYGPRYYDDNPYGHARQPAVIRGRA